MRWRLDVLLRFGREEQRELVVGEKVGGRRGHGLGSGRLVAREAELGLRGGLGGDGRSGRGGGSGFAEVAWGRRAEAGLGGLVVDSDGGVHRVASEEFGELGCRGLAVRLTVVASVV